jgi:hypothetical protein
MEIISPNLEQTKGVAADRLRRNSSVTKFEVKSYDTSPPAKRPGILSGVLKAMGGFAPVAYLAAPFTSGISLAVGAAMSGAGYVGSRAAANQVRPEAAQPMVMMTPGVSAGPVTDPTLDLISSARGASASEAVHKMR